MMKIINAFPGMGDPTTEEETKNFMSNRDNDLLIRIGLIDEKGEPNVIPLATRNSIPLTRSTLIHLRVHKKVHNLRKNNVIAYCIDDPKPPFRGVRGKGVIKVHEDVSHNIPIAKKFIMKNIGTLDDPNAKWLLSEIEKGNEVILEITPSYYSTWRSAIPVK